MPSKIIQKVELQTGETRWELRKKYKDHRVHKYFRTKGQAEDYLKTWLDNIDAGRFGYERVTLEELAEEWLDRKRPGRAAHTIRDYEGLLRRHVLPRFGHLDVADLRPLPIQVFINELERDIGPRTANKSLSLLRQILRHARQMGYITYNPAADVDPAPERRLRAEILTEEEAGRLLEAATGRELAIVSLALGCGLRKGEIFALRWAAIDWIRGVVTVSHSREEDGSLKATKTERIRAVDLPAWTREALEDHYQAQGRPGPDEYLFPGRDGGSLNPSSWHKKYYMPLLDRAGVRPVTFHSLRHTHASLLLSRGVDALYVSRRLGHSQISVTHDYYGHLLHRPGTYQETLDQLFPGAPNRHHAEENK